MCSPFLPAHRLGGWGVSPAPWATLQPIAGACAGPSIGRSVHHPRYRPGRRTATRRKAISLTDILGLDDLLAQFVLALGAAMVLGNGFAIYKARQGERPQGAEGQLRTGRAWWLMAVGALISLWGLASLLAG